MLIIVQERLALAEEEDPRGKKTSGDESLLSSGDGGVLLRSPTHSVTHNTSRPNSYLSIESSTSESGAGPDTATADLHSTDTQTDSMGEDYRAPLDVPLLDPGTSSSEGFPSYPSFLLGLHTASRLSV